MTDHRGPGDDSAPTVPGESLFEEGRLLGKRYRLSRLLGRGGMGEVWQAYDLKLRVEVALKCVRPEFFAHAKHRDLLRREVRSARDVLSPNVCRIFDLVEIDGQELVSMEYIDGSTLLSILQNRGPLALTEAVEIAAQFLAGVEAIHRANLVHRDLKPENIMITRAGRVVVMDFGIAKGLPAPVAEPPGTTRPGEETAIEPISPPAGTIAGTPAYMSPEQLRGESVDARADVFSAGVILAEMVSGQGIKDQESRRTLWTGIRQAPATIPETPWEPVIRCAVSQHREARYESAQALSRALEEITLRVEGGEDQRPYPGLASFSEENSEYFFGREAEVEALWKKLQQMQLLAVVGPSGVGKSSFLRAGLLPVMPAGWRCVVCTPGAWPFRALAQALAPELAGEPDAVAELLGFEEPELALKVAGRWRRRHTDCVIMVDQFEELFTQNPPGVQANFAQLLGRIAMEADIHVLLSMRDDFLFHCHEHAALQPILSELTLMGPPTGEGLRRALVQPALVCGYRFEDDSLVDEMLAEVAGERGALPLLAFAAAQLWDRRNRETSQITREVYTAIGGVSGALAQHAEATLERIGSAQQPLVREIFRNLVTAQGTRATRTRGELLSVFDVSEKESADRVLDRLIDARLLTSYETRGDLATEVADEKAAGHAGLATDSRAAQSIEIIHESLLSAWPRLVRWQTQDADGILLRDQLRQAAQLWEERSRSDDLLWTGTAYREFEIWRERYPGGLSESEEAYAAAMTARDRRRRRRRRLVTTGAFLVLLAVLLVVGISRQQAVSQARRAEASRLIVLGREMWDENTSHALSHAIASLELADTREGREFAIETLWKGPTMFRVPAEEGAWGIDFSPDGKHLAAGFTDGEVRIYQRDGGESTTFYPHDFYVQQTTFAPTGRYLLTSDSFHGILKIWSVPDWQPVRTLTFDHGTNAFWRNGGRELLTCTVPLGDESSSSPPHIWRTWPVPEGEARILGRAGTGSWFHLVESVDSDGRYFVDWKGDEVYLVCVDSLDTLSPRLIGRHTGIVEIADLDASRERVAAVSKAGEIMVWSTARAASSRSAASSGGQLLWQGGVHLDLVDARFDPTGEFFITTGSGFATRLWNVNGPSFAEPLQLRLRGQFNLVDFTPERDWMVTSGGATGVTFWPLTKRYPWTLPGEEVRVRGLAFTPDGGWLVSVNWNGVLHRWAMNRITQPEQSEPLQVNGAFDLDICAAGCCAITGTYWGVEIIDLNNSEIRKLKTGGGGVIEAAAIDSDHRYAAGSCDHKEQKTGMIWIWDLATGQSRLLTDDRTAEERDLLFTPDGRLVSAGQDGLWLFDITDGIRQRLREDEVTDVDASRDGRWLLSTGAATGTWLHDLQNRTAQPVRGHDDQHLCTLSPDAKWIVTANGVTGELRLGPITGGQTRLLLRHEGGINALDFSPDGRWVASAGDDGNVMLWPVDDSPPLHTLSHDGFLAKLKELTNQRLVTDPESATGFQLDSEPFNGWAEAPTW